MLIGVYEPRQPKNSAYYRCIEDNYETLERVWDERYRDTYGNYRVHITKVLYKYLDCGDPKMGFARIKCDECKSEFILPFSCKCRYFCPSCHQRRAIEFGECLFEEILKNVPHRQWVFSMPKRLRIYFRFNRKLLVKLSKIAWRILSQYLKESVSVSDGKPGVIISVQTFGDYINFNPHLHIIATDGCFYGDGEFMIGRTPIASDLEKVFQTEILNMLTEEGLINDSVKNNMYNWQHSGFNVYCGLAIDSEDQEAIEKLGRYIIRAPISQERMEYITASKTSDGKAKVIYRSKKTGITKTFDALHWCALLLSHIPDPGEHMVRYYGFYSNKARGQRKKLSEGDKVPSIVNSDVSKKAFRKKWSVLIQKVYNIDPLKCKKCGGKMRIISFIEEEAVINKILKHLNLLDVNKNHDPPHASDSNDSIFHDDQNYYDESQVTKYEDEFSQVNPYED